MENTILAEITWKPANSIAFAGAVASFIWYSTLRLYEDKIVWDSKRIISWNNVIIPLRKVDSVEVITKWNAVWLFLGIITLPLFGLGIIFLILYFIMKERFLIMVSWNNVQAIAVRSSYDIKAFNEFMDKVVIAQNLLK